MKKYKLNYGLSTFLGGLEMLYLIFFTLLPMVILLCIYSGIENLLYFLYLILGYIIIGVIITIIIYLFSRLKNKSIILNNREIICDKKTIYIDNIQYIDFYLGEVGGRGKKGTPYGVNICYKRELLSDELDYIYIERFPVKLLQYILKTNKMIKFSIANLKQKTKFNFIFGIVMGIVMLLIYLISMKTGCQ